MEDTSTVLMVNGPMIPLAGDERSTPSSRSALNRLSVVGLGCNRREKRVSETAKLAKRVDPRWKLGGGGGTAAYRGSSYEESGTTRANHEMGVVRGVRSILTGAIVLKVEPPPELPPKELHNHRPTRGTSGSAFGGAGFPLADGQHTHYMKET